MQQKQIGAWLASGGAVLILAMTLWPATPGAVPPLMVCVLCGSFGLRDAVLNVLLFAPFGAGLRLAGVHGRRALLLAAGVSVAVELAQLAFVPGRSATPGDLLFNVSGTLLGMVLAARWRLWAIPSPRSALRLAWVAAVLWIGLTTFTVWALEPSLPPDAYYGQWAPRLGGFDQFEGDVLAARVGKEPLADGPLSNADRVRQALSRGAPVRVVAMPDASQPRRGGTAPIVAVADAAQRHVFILAQRGDDLLFDEWTRARALGLNAPAARLHGAFVLSRETHGAPRWCDIDAASRAAPGGVTLCAARSAGRVRLAVGAHAGAVPLGAHLGWTLFIPFPYALDDGAPQVLLSALWLACLVVPAAYWLARGATGGAASTPRRVPRVPAAHTSGRADGGRLPRGAWWAFAIAAMTVQIAIGLVAVPAAFGYPRVPWIAAAGALVGSVVGIAAGAWTRRFPARYIAGGLSPERERQTPLTSDVSQP
ncbi:MAG TPA: VanZ family protein [Gemmatimonadaceae bacterium]|nr:VanZ family protein [Gemmatimonadaceae bacterium]